MTTPIDEYLEDLACQAGVRIECAHLPRWPGRNLGVSDQRWIWRWCIQLIRPSKVIAQALSAGCHLVTQRARPRPVWSCDRVSTPASTANSATAPQWR